jgi:hypothetical protein
MSNTIAIYEPLVQDGHYTLAWVDTSPTMPPWSTAKAEELLARLQALEKAKSAISSMRITIAWLDAITREFPLHLHAARC